MGKLVVWLFPQSEKLEITIWFLSSVKWNEKCERRLASADGAEEWKHKFPLPLVLSLCLRLWRGERRVGSSCCFTCSLKWCYKFHWRHGVNHNQQSPFAGEREREWERAVTLCQQTSFNMLSTWPRTLLPVALTRTRTRAQSETRYRYCSLAPALFTLLCGVSVWNECECACVCSCVFTHTPTSAKYSVAINSLCYRWLRCGAVMFLLLSIKCKPKWQLELSTRHSTALYLQKVNSRVATATAVVAGACVTMQFRARLVMCCQRKCQLKLPFVNNGLAPERCPRSAQRGADDSSQTHTQTYVLVLHVCTCVCNVRAMWSLPIGGNWFIPETKGLS